MCAPVGGFLCAGLGGAGRQTGTAQARPVHRGLPSTGFGCGLFLGGAGGGCRGKKGAVSTCCKWTSPGASPPAALVILPRYAGARRAGRQENRLSRLGLRAAVAGMLRGSLGPPIGSGDTRTGLDERSPLRGLRGRAERLRQGQRAAIPAGLSVATANVHVVSGPGQVHNPAVDYLDTNQIIPEW